MLPIALIALQPKFTISVNNFHGFKYQEVIKENKPSTPKTINIMNTFSYKSTINLTILPAVKTSPRAPARNQRMIPQLGSNTSIAQFLSSSLAFSAMSGAPAIAARASCALCFNSRKLAPAPSSLGASSSVGRGATRARFNSVAAANCSSIESPVAIVSINIADPKIRRIFNFPLPLSNRYILHTGCNHWPWSGSGKRRWEQPLTGCRPGCRHCTSPSYP